MENLYNKFSTFLFRLLLGAAFLLFSLQGYSQAQVNINKTGSKPDVEVNLTERANIPFFAQAKRARAFDLNSGISNPQGIQTGNKIRLQLFKDKDFPSTIVRKKTDINGVTALTVKLDDFKYAFGHIVVSENSYLITIDIPELNEQYTTRTDKETDSDFIFLLDETKMEKFEECELIIPSETDDGIRNNPDPGLHNEDLFQETDGNLNTTGETSTFTPADPAVIDIMIVYTPAAQEWSNTYDDGINNTIATAMATANNVSTNSELGIEFNLIDSRLVNYTEQDNGYDLYALRNESDGEMDEIHQIRKDVRADMVAIFTNSGGGVAYLLKDKYGSPDLGFSLTGIRSAKTFTFPHELGHNMGIGHYKYQNVQPGNTSWNDWPENTWSGGWRWESTDSNLYCDIMTYEGGQYHQDGITSYRIPYFSDPNHIYIGAKAGDEVEGNGSRTLRDIKHVIGNYSNTILYCSAAAGNLSTLYINRVELGDTNNSSQGNGYSDYSSIAFPINAQETQLLQMEAAGYGSKKQVLLWIDWNDDKIFDPVTELEYASGENQDLYTVSITAPLGVEPGSKRMRIRLQDLDLDTNSSPCGNTEQGEVEDYMIHLIETPACDIAEIPQNLQPFKIEDSHYTLAWDIISGISSYEIRYKKSTVEDWNNVTNILYPFYKLEGLEASTLYEAQVRSICSGEASEYSALELTTTDDEAKAIAFVDQPKESQAEREMTAVSVELLDELGNRKNSTAEVTIKLIDDASTGAILTGTTTVAAIEGLATFKDLQIDLTGTYTFDAEYKSLTPERSNTFTLKPFEQAEYVVTSKENDGFGTLREAIDLANESEYQDLITFNIDGTGPHSIMLLENLPPITQKIELDATSQPNYSTDAPQIIIDGSKLPNITGTIQLEKAPKAFYVIANSSGSSIKGFVLGGFGSIEELEDGAQQTYFGAAILTQGTSSHTITRNFIGISVTGNETFSNYHGIYMLGGAESLIGGLNSGDSNLISGNYNAGVAVSSDGNNNHIIGNQIGFSSDGTIPVPNRTGIIIYGGASENFIESNIILGNSIGIHLTGKLNYVFNNYIGVDPTGAFAIPNDTGISISSQNNIIGKSNRGNVISGNTDNGIYINSYSKNNEIKANIVGANVDGKTPLGNGSSGINIQGSDNTVGGLQSGEENLIAYNGSVGVEIYGWGAIKNRITGNKMFSNVSMGIDLNADGITQNDKDDTDGGPNNLQNFPEIKNSASLEDGLLKLEYIVSSGSQYAAYPLTVEFFKSDGTRQGKEYLGTDIYTESDITKGRKGKSISLELVAGNTLNGGDKLLATATDAEGNTSEFGPEVDVTGGCTETTWYADKDEDGLGDPNDTQDSCTQPEGYVSNSDDCDDNDPDVGAGSTWYADADGDGFGNPDVSETACDQPVGYVANSDDCDDTDATVNPEATDVCKDCDTTNDVDCEAPGECLGTDVITISDCTDGSSILWTLTNTGSCTVDVRWESRKTNESGIVTVAMGDTSLTTKISGKGPTQLTIYWPDSNGTETKTSTNASGTECTSSTGLTSSSLEETADDPDDGLKVIPNPITDDGIWLHFAERESASRFQVSVYDLGGYRMAQTSVDVDVKGRTILWEVYHGRWKPGIYILIANNGEEVYQIKIIK